MRGRRAIERTVFVTTLIFRHCAALIFALSATGQPPAPNVAEVLQKVKATYTNMSGYRLSETVTEGASTASIRVTVQRPNRLRWEVSGSGAATYTGMYVGEEVIVSDGNNVFWYRPKLGQYTKTPLGPLVTPEGTVSAFIDHIEDTLFQGFKSLGAFDARLLREEAVSINGSRAACYVIKITTPLHTAFTWWIDKKSSLVLREAFELNRPPEPPSLTRRTEFTVIQIGGPIDQQSFVFIPPPGARQTDAFRR